MGIRGLNDSSSMAAAIAGFGTALGSNPQGSYPTLEERLDGAYFDVKDYGATGDGTTDDTAAIQAALTAAGQTAVTGRVFFPGGTYRVTETLDLPQGVELIGSGASNTVDRPATFIDASNLVSGPVMRHYDADATKLWHHAGIRRIRINGGPSHGVHLQNGIGECSTIDQVMITGCAGDGVRIDGNSTPSALGHVSFHSNGGAGLRLSSQQVTHTQVLYLAGDNNGESLMTIDTLNTTSTVNVIGWKAERWGDSPGNPNVFVINNGNGALVDLGMGRVAVGAGVSIGNAVVRQTAPSGSVARVRFAYGLNDASGSGGYTYGYQDTKNSITGTISATSRRQVSYGYPNSVGVTTSQFVPIADLIGGAALYFATASPVAALTATPGSVCLRSDGSIYLKESGSDTSGWARLPALASAQTWSAIQTFTAAVKVNNTGLGSGFRLGATSTDYWEWACAGSGSNSLYWRYVGGGADDRWVYFSKNAGVGAGNDTIQMRPGATTMLDLTTTKAKVYGPMQLASYATGSRPSASSSGAGSVIYDTTLSKPVFSDGTNWRDAAGTVV